MAIQQNAVRVFISYAHQDVSFLRDLETHLSLLKRQGLISTWYDRQIVAGTDWSKVIDQHLEHASIILLLISPEFLASDYCFEIEMQRALQRHEAGEACVVPILVRPCDWKGSPLAQLQCLPSDGKPVTIWKNRDIAWTDVVSGLRRLVEDLSLLPASVSRAALPAVWNVPYPRNPFFTGRDDVLTRLHTQLQAGQSLALSQPQAISGLGGIGKTQLAVEYAYRYCQEYEVVLWASAESQEALLSSYNTIAALLRLPEREAPEQEIVIQAVKRWLQTHHNWLLILDNADDLDLLPPVLPSASGGQLLLTTRAWDMQRLAQRLEVQTFSPDQGAVFLLRRAGLLAADAELSQAIVAEHTFALQLSNELGGLPLALDQAGAYLEATGMSLEQYQQVYRGHRQVLLQERRARVPDHPEPVATTWSLSFTRVEEKDAAAADLLCLCAYLSADAIPEEILTQGASVLGPLLESVVGDPLLLGRAIEALRAYSLVERDPRARTLSVHRLVQVVLQDRMNEENGKQWVERAIRAVHAVLPTVEHRNWSRWERVVPHVQICAQHMKQYATHMREAVKVLQQTGWYLTERARYNEAEPLLEQAYVISEREQGSEHLDTARDALTLAYLYKAQGKYAQAEPLYQHALSIYKQQLGAEHPNVASSLNNLADLYRDQGKYEEAEPLYQRALAIREQQLGAEHPNTAGSLNNLALLYYEQGRYGGAEPLYQRALANREQQLGALHPSTAQSLNNLADLYYKQGRYAEAEPLYQRALANREQQLGALHPSTAQSLNNLALLYKTQGKYEEAEPLYKQALAIREQQLGGEHPSTAQSLNNLALLYKTQGKYEEAEPLYKQALAIREQQLGGEHPSTAQSLNNLAGLYRVQGKYAQAEPLYQRALAIREQQLGALHPDTASSLNNLAALYDDQGKYREAEPLLRRALSICEQQLGALHPDTVQSLSNLAALYDEQGRYEEAEPLYQRALSICEQQLGALHSRTQMLRRNYASLLQAVGREEEASLLERNEEQL